jgi:hypothetical protein
LISQGEKMILHEMDMSDRSFSSSGQSITEFAGTEQAHKVHVDESMKMFKSWVEGECNQRCGWKAFSLATSSDAIL